MNVKSTISKYAQEIDKEVAYYLKSELETSKHISPLIKELVKYVIDSIGTGGKRLRGIFVISSYELFGGTDTKEIMKIAVYIEIIHAWLLVHDDIMDRADKRRGLDTIHEIYNKMYAHKFSKEEETRHFSNSVAICVGDILSQLANKILLSSNFSDDKKTLALKYASRQLTNVAYGQVMDLFCDISEVDEEYVKTVYKYKTGEYTYETPLFLGAIFAGIKDMEDIKPLKEYSLHGGIAYQIIDDIIDLFSDYEKTGKQPGRDIMEGKKTLLITKAIEQAEPKSKATLKKYLGKSNLSHSEIELCKSIIEETGSLDYSKRLAKDLLELSSSKLASQIHIKQEKVLDFLIGLNKYMHSRIYEEDNNFSS